MTHYTNTNNPIDFPKKKKIPMLERFAAQSLVEHEGELIFSKEKFAELILKECIMVCWPGGESDVLYEQASEVDKAFIDGQDYCVEKLKKHFGVE